MYNRKFDIKKDFEKLNKFENVIKPLINSIPNEENKKIVLEYVREIFNNQFKNN